MDAKKLYQNPEPVPEASQLAVLPFISAINGYLQSTSDVSKLRITMHRRMSRERKQYLQQMCAYLRGDEVDSTGKVGRIFHVNTGIIGAAFREKRIWRTKRYKKESTFLKDLRNDDETTGGEGDLSNVARSFLAIPFLGPKDDVVLVFYGDCYTFNFFADNKVIERVVAMSQGFCDLYDWLQRSPFPNLRNFPFEPGTSVAKKKTLFETVQEPLKLEPPRFQRVSSFNYEAAHT
jgi:hypothetical protein